MLGRLLLVVLLLTIGGGLAWALVVVTASQPGLVGADLSVSPAPVEPGSAVPGVAQPLPGQQEPVAQGSPDKDPVTGWANRVSSMVDIPARALRAYAIAGLVTRQHNPGCNLSWATVAGIGRIESNHGRYGNAQLDENGRPAQPIIGVPLNGSTGLRDIADTDKGRLDGDTTHDRAVGPMQFIPSTWARWASDGDGDGKADPQDIDDAAVSAARYLCSGSRDLATGRDWWAGVLSYNNSTEYGQKVFGLADSYARASLKR